MYSYTRHLKIKGMLTHMITGMTGWHMPLPPSLCLPPPTSLHYDWNG